MDIEFQRKLAEKAGKTDNGNTWAKEYDYHLGMVRDPLPFFLFQSKTNLLMLYLKRDPDGADRALDSRINQLSEELGC